MDPRLNEASRENYEIHLGARYGTPTQPPQGNQFVHYCFSKTERVYKGIGQKYQQAWNACGYGTIYAA